MALTDVAQPAAGPIPGELVELDPSTLLASSNVRSDLGDLEELTASVRAVGVLQPPIVSRNGEGGYSIVFGFRRVAAAVAAGRSPIQCIVRDDLVDAGRLVGQMAENMRRADLSAADVAAGYEQLAAFGLDVGTIAEQLGSAPDHVEQGLKLAKAPKAMAVAAKYSLGLDDAAAIAEFDNDADAVKALTVVLMGDRPELFDHTVSRLRQARADAAARAEIIANLGDVPLVETYPNYYIIKGQPTRLSELRDDNNKAITPAKHRKCPGHAAWIDDNYQGPKLIWVCADPVANKHKDIHGSTGRGSKAGADAPPEAKAKVSEERKEVIKNNKEWRAADPVRKEWLDKSLYPRAAAPKGALRYAVTAMLTDPGLLSTHGAALRGEELTKALACADNKLPVLLLGLVCRAMEASLTTDAWRRPPRGTAAYLEFLGSAGYPLSDVENVAIKASKKNASRGW